MSKKNKRNSTRPTAGQQRAQYTDEQLEAMRRQAGFEDLEIQTDADGVDILPVSKGRTDAGSYRFRIAGDDKTYRLPNLQYIDMDLAMKLRGGISDEDAMGELFERYAPELLGQVDGEQLTALTDRWRKHSAKSAGAGITEVGLGE